MKASLSSSQASDEQGFHVGGPSSAMMMMMLMPVMITVMVVMMPVMMTVMVVMMTVMMTVSGGCMLVDHRARSQASNKRAAAIKSHLIQVGIFQPSE